MKEDRESLITRIKEEHRILINVTLLGICFTLFTFLVALNVQLLRDNFFLSLQLVCAIPLLMTSLLAKVKSSTFSGYNKWRWLGFNTYLLGYAFLINVVGIFLINYVSLTTGIIFFVVNVVLALIYSDVEIYYNKSRLRERIRKDLEFILILILLGILPAVGVY